MVMGDVDLDTERRLRRGRRWFTVGTLTLVGALVAGGAWANAQVPEAVALQVDSAAGAPIPTSIFDAHAGQLTDRVAQAAGRTLDSLAAGAPGPVANPAETQAPVVAGDQVASEEYARTLEELTAAEQAAAEDLAMSEQEAEQAEADRSAASQALADEEAAAAREVDAAIDGGHRRGPGPGGLHGPVRGDLHWGRGGHRFDPDGVGDQHRRGPDPRAPVLPRQPGGQCHGGRALRVGARQPGGRGQQQRHP